MIVLFCPTCDGSYPETEWRQTIAALPVVASIGDVARAVMMAREMRHSRCKRRAGFVTSWEIVPFVVDAAVSVG